MDGVLENTTNYSYNQVDFTTSTALSIGNYAAQNGQYFQGDIDEVRVWRTVRSAADIQQNMCRKFVTAPADLVAYYRLDQSSGLTATDEGSQAVTGSLVGFSGSPWHTSGAPLGDASTALYQTSLPAGARLALASAAGDSAVVSGISALARGVQLYTVGSAPSIAAASGAQGSYFGVFTAGSSTPATYSLRLHPANGSACWSAQQRISNDLAWSNLNTVVRTPTSLVYAPLTYRGEYILVAGMAPPAVAIAGDSAVCAGATGRLTAAATGATGYRWSTGASTASVSGLVPGTYTVTASFASGCTSTGQATIRAARSYVPTISGDAVLCTGATGQLTATATGAASLRWNTGATTATIAVTQAGTYSVVATSAAGCTSQATYQVQLLAVAPVTLSGDSLLCQGSTGQLTAAATGATAYRWSTGATTASISGVVPGTYSVTASFANGCAATAQRLVRLAPTPTVSLSGDSVLCATTGRVVASAANAATYRWSTGATTSSISVAQAGTYSVVVASAAGCTSTASFRVRAGRVAPTFTLGADTTLCEGSTLTLHGPTGPGLRYQWSDGSTGPQLLASAAGTYSLRVTTECSTTQAARVVGLKNCLLVPNIITPNNDTRNDLFVVQGLTGTDWSLDVYNRWGRPVLHTDSYRNDWGSEAAPGMYYVLLRRPSTGYSYKGWVEVVR